MHISGSNLQHTATRVTCNNVSDYRTNGQKPIKNFGKSSRGHGHTQGLSKLRGTHIQGTHIQGAPRGILCGSSAFLFSETRCINVTECVHILSLNVSVGRSRVTVIVQSVTLNASLSLLFTFYNTLDYSGLGLLDYPTIGLIYASLFTMIRQQVIIINKIMTKI